MGSDLAAELLQLPVMKDDIRLGHSVEVVVDDAAERVVGVVVLCGDEEERFLALDAAQVRDGEIAVGSAFVLLEDVDFYRRRGRSVRG
jgi:hypothetical protein